MNAFEVFGLEARPFTDPQELRRRYLDLAAAAHPDRTEENAQAREINEAYEELRRPAIRLRLLCGNASKKPPLQLTPRLQEIFERFSGFQHQVRQHLQKKKQAQSRIARAQLAPLQRELLEKAAAFDAQFADIERELQTRLLEIDKQWNPETADFQLLQDLAQKFLVLERWQAQLRESLFLLRA